MIRDFVLIFPGGKTNLAMFTTSHVGQPHISFGQTYTITGNLIWEGPGGGASSKFPFKTSGGRTNVLPLEEARSYDGGVGMKLVEKTLSNDLPSWDTGNGCRAWVPSGATDTAGFVSNWRGPFELLFEGKPTRNQPSQARLDIYFFIPVTFMQQHSCLRVLGCTTPQIALGSKSRLRGRTKTSEVFRKIRNPWPVWWDVS